MKFSTKEIIDMAVKIEDTGYVFYTECAKKFGKDLDGSKENFLFLADEELKHKNYFLELLNGIESQQGVFDDDYYSYLQALTQVQVFRDASDIPGVLKQIISVSDVLKIGLQTEKDSIIWYKELGQLYDEKDHESMSILNKLIDEEKRHIVMIYNMMRDLSPIQ